MAAYGVPIPKGMPYDNYVRYVIALQQLVYHTYGLWGVSAHEFIVARLWVLYETSLVSVWWVLPAHFVLTVGVLWLLNPAHVTGYSEEYPMLRYMMTYRERMWWAEAVKLERPGVVVYRKLAEIPGQLVMQQRNAGVTTVPGKREWVDRFYFGQTWREERGHRWWMWTAIDWEVADCDFIGLLHHTGAALYQLREGYKDPWVF